MDRRDPQDRYQESDYDTSIGQSGVQRTERGFETQPGMSGETAGYAQDRMAEDRTMRDEATAPGGYGVNPAAAGLAGAAGAGTGGGATGVGAAGLAATAGGGFDAWNYRQNSGWSPDQDVIGYHVEATDGKIGKIDEASDSVGSSYLVVDTGPWIFGRKVMLPAGTITNVDHADRRVYVDRTKDQIKDSPEFDPDTYTSDDYRESVGGYYGGTYSGGYDDAADGMGMRDSYQRGMEHGMAGTQDRYADGRLIDEHHADSQLTGRRSDGPGGAYPA